MYEYMYIVCTYVVVFIYMHRCMKVYDCLLFSKPYTDSMAHFLIIPS